MKIDDSGNVITAKLVPLDFNYWIIDMQAIDNNKFIIAANNLAVPGTCLTKLYVIDTSSNILDSQSVSFSSFIRFNKILLPGNGDIIFLGEAARYDTSHSDFYALRTDSSLNFPPIGIKSISQTGPNQFQLYQNYPNPFNPVTRIKFDISPLSSIGEGLGVRLVIYDLLGREVAVLVNQALPPGTYEVTWDGTNYPSGVYFYQLKTQGSVETKKMVLLK
jgi:hypothetical protein